MNIEVVQIEGADEGLFDRYVPFLGPESQDRIARFRRLNDRLLSLFGEILIRVNIAEKWGFRQQEIVLSRNEYGKPFLAHMPTCQFNIAHSGHWVAGVFDESAVGIDIEQICPVDVEALSSCFTVTERVTISNKPVQEWGQTVVRLWTLKESYIKARGMGLSIPLQSFSIVWTKDGTASLHSNVVNYYHGFQEYTVDDYTIAVCAERTAFPKEITKVTWQNLIERFEVFI